MSSKVRALLELVTTFGGFTIPVFINSHPLSLAIPPWVGAVSIGHRWGRHGEFCVAVGSVLSTAGVLAYCMLA